MSSNKSRALRPTNRVSVSDQGAGKVLAARRKKQGGAWVAEYRIRFAEDGRVRRVSGRFVRPSQV